MDGLRPLVIPVDDEIEHVAALCLHRDELLAGGCPAQVVNEGQVPIRCQGCPSAPGEAGGEQLQQGGEVRPVQGEGEAARVRDGQVVGMNIALPLRQKHLDPFALGADDFYLRPIGKLGEGVVIQPSAGADIQVAAAGGHGAGLLGFPFLRVRGEQDTVLGDSHSPQAAQQFGDLVQGVPVCLRVIVRAIIAGGIFLISDSDLRGLGVLRRVRLRPGSFGVVGFALPTAGESGDSKGRGTERHGQGRRKQADDLLIPHTRYPPSHSRRGPPRPPPPSCPPAG